MNWRVYGKFIAAALTAVIMAGYAVYREAAAGGMTPSEWLAVVVAAVTALQVWAAANVTGFQQAKTVVAICGWVLSLLAAVGVGGLTTDDIVLLVIQALGTIAVAGSPALRHATRPVGAPAGP